MKLLRAIWLFCTGRFSGAYQTLMGNRYVMEATYDASIEKTKGRIGAMSEAISGLIRTREDKVSEVGRLTNEYKTLQDVKAGALGKARQRMEVLQKQKKTPEQIKQDAEYVRCQTAYNNADKDAAGKDTRIKELEAEIERMAGVIATRKAELQTAKHNHDALKSEKREAIADVLSAQQEEAIARQLSGLEEDTTDKDLAAARDARKNARAKSQTFAELAGTDAKATAQEFADFGRMTTSNSEFDKLMGMDGSVAEKPAETTDPAKLPES